MHSEVMKEAHELLVDFDACLVPDDYTRLEKGTLARAKLAEIDLDNFDIMEVEGSVVPTVSSTCSSGAVRTRSNSGTSNPKSGCVIKKDDFLYDNTKEPIGSGRFARVYVGTWVASGEQVAIKVFKDDLSKDDFEKSFMKEEVAFAHMCNRFHNVIHYMGFCLEKKTIVMELVKDPKNLREVLEGSSIAARLQIMLQVAKGMACVHNSGIIHKDLKPENVLCSGDLTDVKIADFGISSLANNADRTTGRQNIFHSMAYSAPEQSTGAALTQKCDVWAFGMMTLEMCVYEKIHHLWADEKEQKLDSVQINEKKKIFCKEVGENPTSFNHYLSKLLPIPAKILMNSKHLKVVSDLVVRSLHPDVKRRPNFEDCQKELNVARTSMAVLPSFTRSNLVMCGLENLAIFRDDATT